MLYLILWSLFAIFSAVIASAKNRGAIEWALIGFFLGPFGLIVGLLPAIELQDKIKKQVMTCKKCNEEIIHASKVCRFCNTKYPYLSEPIRSHVELIGSLYISINDPAVISEKLNTEGPQCATNNGAWTKEIVDEIIKSHI